MSNPISRRALGRMALAAGVRPLASPLLASEAVEGGSLTVQRRISGLHTPRTGSDHFPSLQQRRHPLHRQ